jgi:uncharacterized membrane protein
MISILTIVSLVIAAFGLGRYISFSSHEGKDERGQYILAKSSHVTISVFFLAYAIIILIINFLNISADALGLIVIAVLSGLIVINGGSIMYFRKKI